MQRAQAAVVGDGELGADPSAQVVERVGRHEAGPGIGLDAAADPRQRLHDLVHDEGVLGEILRRVLQILGPLPVLDGVGSPRDGTGERQTDQPFPAATHQQLRTRAEQLRRLGAVYERHAEDVAPGAIPQQPVQHRCGAQWRRADDVEAAP
jgi:hypothetical protein